MEMKIVNTKNCLCTCCMEEHDVKEVRVLEKMNYKNLQVEYEATYFYCELADEFYANEEQIHANDVALKDAYRVAKGLLTTKEIIAIREKYGISQSDLCSLLGWGGKTITRYESSQVQDKAHDTILRKLNQDPEWFLQLLNAAKENVTLDAYKKYLASATNIYEQNKDLYLIKSIEAQYARFRDNMILHGNVGLSLEKVIDVIRYFAASSKVSALYKVKLMKLMWYADALSYKKRGCAITGLVYQALPMGAVPLGHELIIDLQNVPCTEVDMGEYLAYHFKLNSESEYPALLQEDMMILNEVIDQLGGMSKRDIVAFMHKEKAYVETASRDFISFEHAKTLQI